jgi:thiol-disulfide isomerase/thioredoxin
MRSIVVVVVALVLLAGGGVVAGDEGPDIEVWTAEGCPYCEAGLAFLEELARQRPDLRIVVHDVGGDAAALARLREEAGRHGVTALGVPAFHVRDRLIVGFGGAETTGALLASLVTVPRPSAPPSPGPAPEDSVTVPFLGRLSARDVGLPAFTIALGLLDGFNPCAMWVLLFVLSLLVNLKDRVRMLLIGGTFVLVSGVAYFAFMAAWLNVFLLVGVSRATQVVVGVIAGVVGAINIKDFFAFRRGPSLGIPEAARPGLYARMRRIVQAENLAGALAGVVVLALLVNVIELLCTAGFPAVYTRVLTLRALPRWEYYGYLALYNAAYVVDDGIMVAVAVATLSRLKLQERGGRWLKLVSGVVMVALGLVLVAAPRWLA